MTSHMSSCLTLWANHYFHQHRKKIIITDLFYDLRSGEVLLDLLLILFSCDSTKDSGQLNVGKLNNITAALALLQKERVGVDSEVVTAQRILQGDVAATLSLVWSIAFHYEARAALAELSLPDTTVHTPNIDSLLTGWVRTVSPEADLASSDLSDGIILANLVLASRPNLVSLTAALEAGTNGRPGKIFKAISSHLEIPALPVPVTADKKISVLQLLLVLRSLRPRITMEVLSDCPEGDPEYSLSSCKTPVRKIAGDQMLSLNSWTNVLEEVLSWLLEAEDHLLSLNSLGQKHLETVKTRFYNHEDFMLELKNHQSAVGEVLSQGRNLLSSSLTPDDSKDVRLQMKVLNERWEKVRELAMSKQTELHRLVMKLQVEQMEDLKCWMTGAEDKLSLIGGTGKTPAEVAKLQSDLSELLSELEEQQGVVSGISNFILVDGQDSSPGALEDELAALGERWVTLCRVCEERQQTFTRLTSSWQQHSELSTVLRDWMDKVELSLRQMELDEEPDQEELARQSQHVMETEEEFVKYEKKLVLLCEVGEGLESEAGGTVEALQDRWDVLIEILGAQKQRISRLGVELKHLKERESSVEVPVNDTEVNSDAYEKYEETVSRIKCWAEHILTRLEDGLKSLDLVDQQLLLEETEAELRSQAEHVDGVFKEGKNLKSDLEPHLEPLNQLLSSCLARREDIEVKLEKLRDSIKYQIEKRKFSEAVENLESVLNKSEAILREINLRNPESLQEIEAQSELIKSKESALEDVKKTATELSVHTAAVDDPGNTIKTSQYKICEKFEKLEEQLSSIKLAASQIANLPSSSEDEVSSGETVRNTQEGSDCDETSESESKTETVYQSPLGSGLTSSMSSSDQRRSQIKLESDLNLCKEFLSLPLILQHPEKMDQEKSKIADHCQLFEDAFVPAYLSEEEAAELVDQMKTVKMELKQREEELESLSSSYFQWREELQGLSMWMQEVEVFLNAEEATIGDILHLEAQLKESDALQDDVKTLQPNLELINETGSNLIKHCDISDSFHLELQEKLSVLNSDWDRTISAATEQNEKLRQSLAQSNEVMTLVSDLNQFLDQLESELASTESDPVTAAPQLSQRTLKLLQLRERTEAQSSALHRLSTIEVGVVADRVTAVQDRWSEVTGPVHENYGKMKEATSDYGEFKTLVAQETDWLDRLEKKLRRSSKCAADAEEISEELDDLENCLNNHPLDRLERLTALASALSRKDILISPVQTEAELLTKKWTELETSARLRIKSLEDCILEAQEWECKILAVQDWLQEKDLMLTSHLEHELTVEDILDEAQRMLREFEDKENLLAEMEGQVDTYREEGKEEAAARLEDQLSLIHCKYQELSGKFELFQRPSDYDGRLGRITRQLVDLQSNMYLTELVSHEPEAIQGQLHHTRCVYNALANIKPEVEATIKMGRKLVETDSVSEPEATTKNIDNLKELFNLLGAQVTEARGNLEKALEVSERLMNYMTEIFSWLEETEEMLTHDREPRNVMARVKGMKNMKCRVRELLAVKTELISLCGDPSLLSGLKELLAGLEARWSEVKVMLQEAVGEEEVEMKDLSLDSDDDTGRMESPGEESLLLKEFRTEFQDISAWMDETERRLEENRDMSLDELSEVKIDNLAAMAMKIIEKFSAQSVDIEPEIESLKQRWRSIVIKLEQRNPSPSPHAPPAVAAVMADPEEIVTLPEEQPTYQQSPMKRSFPVESFINYKSDMSSKIPRPTTTPSGGQEKKIPPPTLPKPRWYVESLRNSSPVKQVVVTSTTLPSPRPSGTTSSTVEVSKEPSPNRTEITRIPTSLDDEVLDRQLAKDHAEIDQLLQGTSDDIEDVKARSLSRGSHAKDIKQFIEASNNVDIKMGQVKMRLEQISSESDLGLRCDLVEMETQQVEAEVETLISRGETLIMIHRQDARQREALQSRVDRIRDSWRSVVSSADSKKSEAKTLSEELERFLKCRDSLLSWLEELRGQIAAAKEDKRELGALARRMELKKPELTNINKLGNKLTAANSFKGQESSLTTINQRWEAARQDCSIVSRREHSKSASPKESVTKTYPAELNNKITRVREAVSAVEKQLTLSVLTGKKFEKLQQQQETLERVRTAIETLRPNIKKLEKDLELMSGATVSMEYFEKLTSLGEKCREEWARVNKKYQSKRDLLDEAKFDFDKHHELELAANHWLSNKEDQLRNLKQNNKRDLTANEALSRIEAEVEDWASFLSQFTELSRKISSESDGLQARKVSGVLESLEKRYKLLTKGVMNKKNQNDVLLNENEENIKNINITVSWAEDCLALITKQVNVSDVKQLLDTISHLEKAQAEAIKQRLALDEYSGQVGVNNPVYQQSRGKVERIIQMLPKRLGFLADRKERAVKMKESVAEFQAFVTEIRRKRNSALSAPELMKQRLAVSDKEFQMNKLNNDFLLLEREVTGSGMDMESDLAADMKELKVNWLSLLEEVRRMASSVNGNTEEVQSPAESVVSLGTISTTNSQEMMASPSTQSVSPLSDEVASSPSDTTARCKQVSAWLSDLEEETEKMKVRVDNCEAVAREVDKLRNFLQQLDAKKCQMEDIVSSGAGHFQENDINTVKSDWRRVQQKLLGRKTELTAMLEHSDNLDSKGREVSEWLGKLERQLAGASVGKTRVVLLGQIRDVNQVMRELQKYNHHVTLFTQLCQRLVSIYSRDLTGGVQQLAGELSGRYSGLTTSCTARAKSLQTALENINMFDRELAEFLAWLGEMESSLERLEGQQQPSTERLAELQGEVRNRDRQFCSLTTRGKDQIQAAGETDIVLGSKVGELGRRWSGLQNMMMGLQDKLEREDDARDRMEDILGWLAQKRTEVESIAVGENLTQVRRQLEENRAFRDKLEVKMAEFSNILQSYQMDSRLDEEWRKLIAVTENLTRELEQAERSMMDMETTLTELDRRLCRVESDQAGWTSTPQLEAVEAETLAVEVISSELIKLEEDVMKARIASDSGSQSKVSAERLVSMEQRLTAAREAVTRRSSELKSLEVIPDPGTQEFLNSSVPQGWERGLTEDFVPFFSCHHTQGTQWDHPEFEALLQSVSAMNTVKFSAYRMALKLRKIQQKLCLDLLDITSAVVCFESHGLGADKDDLTICVPEVVTVLTSIYETLYQCEPEDITVNLCVDLALNWILNVYDSQRQGFVRVLSFKLAIVLLCRGPLVEKYSVMFNIAAGEEETLDQRRLALFLYDLVMVPKYLGEVAQFGGTNIEPSVRSCLSVGTSQPRTSLSCPQFVQWLQEEPQSLVWLPVLHRLASAETATHHVKCKICKVDPIVGFRYHCRKCFNLDICHACFFVGQTYKGCKPEHPFIEYCTSTTKTDNAKHILQAVRNSFRGRKYFKKKKAKLGYLPVQSVLEGESFESPAMSPNLSFESRDLIPDSTAGSMSGRPGAEDDEHSLIAAYCKMLTGSNSNNNNISSTASILLDVDARVEGLEQERVEQMLAQLKEENAKLEAEYNQLVVGKGTESVEEKTLKQQRSRLEARMTILEDHNRQLEAQLERLRQLVQSETASPISPGLQARYVVAADLQHEDVDIKIVTDRPQPPTSLSVPPGLSDRSSGSYSDEQRLSGTSGSLNLSQHNTETVQDDDI